MKEIYTTIPFDCPTTGKPVIGVFFPTMNEMKFRLNYETEKTDWETLDWCMKASTRIVGGIEAANSHVASIGLDNSRIFFE
ncbi:hypothetical protein BSK59_13200 [Paenibacillus odorifer]|uniref:hypothetical protein n=1 Tax=Paenibacillus odorifer TaxID=189426 RepID=UPI00096F9D17|nr:hypothetical protein [Paenibacillus odorifer]OME55429.1 hypothetical protein BSK59_13200 [Paenibacillus odorifer]